MRNAALLVVTAGLVFQCTARGQPVTKTGDVLVLAPEQLKMDNNTLVKDEAAPGGEAVESAGKRWYIVHAATPRVPAGRYRVTARIKVLKRTVASHVGRLIVNSGSGDQVDDLTRPFGTEDFEAAGTYRDLSIELVRPPQDKGTFSLLVRILHENPQVPVRVAHVEIEALAVPPVLVHKVWPQKLLARCNADQPITVSLSNVTAEPQSGLNLELELIHGLGKSVLVGARDVALKPYESAEIVFPWNTGEREYGYEARATLLDAEGNAISRHSDYFAVSRSHFKLRILGTSRYYGSFLDERSMLRTAMQRRLTYGNYVEVYGWPPGAFVELYPRHRFWSSGQVYAWQYDRDVMKAWIDEMHRLGMWVTAYNISLFNGWPGQEAMRKHPEWCAFNELGRPAGNVNTAHWETKEMVYGEEAPPARREFIGEMPNSGGIWPLDEELLRKAADEIVRIHRELGFDGMRWDGHPILYITREEPAIKGTEFGRMIWNYRGERVVDLIPDGDLDRRSLHNMRLIKGTVRREAPDFEWGYNAGYDLTAEQQPQTWQEVAANAGIWVEGGFRSGDEGRADPTNTWDKYMDKLWLSSWFVRTSGGYPIHGALAAESSVMRRFMNAIFLAQGSHVAWHGGTWGEYTDYSRFATRYSQYLFDPAIHPWWGYPDIHVTGWVQWEDRNASEVPPMSEEAKIESDRPLFFPEKMLFHREASGTRKETILHLVNHPGKPYIDYTDIDAPPVQQDIGVSLRIPRGMRPAEAWCLSPDDWPMEERLDIRPAGEGWVKVTVPRLATWDVLVVAWTAEGQR